MPVQPFKPGNASYSPTPSEPTEVYNIENMDRDVDGFWRPRWGLKFLDSFSGAITHISTHPNDTAVMMIYDGGKLAYWVNSGSKGDIDTGWPTGPVKATVAPGTAAIWLAHKAAISSDSAAGLYQVTSAYADSAVAAAPNGTWAEVHNRIVFSINSANDTIAWSDYDDHTTWPAANDATKMPEMFTAEAFVNYGNNKSIIFGQQGLTEVTGGADDEISTAPIQKIAVVMPAYVILKAGDRILFLCPGPRLMQWQYGRMKRIDWPVNKDMRAWPSVTNLRAWHDTGRNIACFTDLTTYTTWLYGIEEERWVGKWTYGNAQDTAMLGGASFTGAVDQPYVLEFVAVGSELYRWDSTLYKDEVDSTPGNAVSFRCTIESRPTNLDDQSSLKRLRSVYADVSGDWTVYLKYRNTVDGSWTQVTWGTTSGPGNITAPAKYEFREFELKAVANSASNVKFRALLPELQIVSRARF